MAIFMQLENMIESVRVYAVRNQIVCMVPLLEINVLEDMLINQVE